MPRVLILVALLLVCVEGFAQTPASTSSDAATKAESFLSRMSTLDKIDYLGGTGFAVRAVPALGLPAFQMSDGPFGVRSNERLPSTSYAIGISW